MAWFLLRVAAYPDGGCEALKSGRTMSRMGELVAALRANDPDLFKRWLHGGIQDLGEPAVTEMLLDWLDPFLTKEEQDRLLGLHPSVVFR